MSAVLLLLAGGCTREMAPEQLSREGDLLIRLTLTDPATRSGETPDPEDRVSTLDILIYESADATAPLNVKHVGIQSGNQLDGEFEVPLTLANDFGNDPSKVKFACLFVVANYPGTIPTNQSLSDIKNLVLTETGQNATATFLSGTTSIQTSATPNFVMTAEGMFDFEAGENNNPDRAVATLELQRLAAKITMELSFPTGQIVTRGTENFFGPTSTTTTWTPMTEGNNSRAYLVNAKGKGYLGALSKTSYPSDGAFDYDAAILDFTQATPSASPSTSISFYTYPMALGNVSDPYIKLILPWRYETTMTQDGIQVTTDESTVELYYKIFFPTDLSELKSNTHYTLPVEISVLGGEANRPTVQVTPQITVSPWGSTAGELNKVSYVEAHFITLSPDGTVITQPDPLVNSYNVTVTDGKAFSIPFYASEEVEMTINEIWFNRLTKDGPVKKQIVVNGAYGSDYSALINDANLPRPTWDDSGNIPWEDWVTIAQEDENHLRINLNHTLSHLCEGDSSSDFTVTPYHYELTLKLKNRSETATVSIEQIPKILITQQLSNRKVFVNNTANNTDYSSGQTYKGVATNKDVYQIWGEPSNVSHPSGNSANITSYLGLLRNRNSAFGSGAATSSNYRFTVTVVPYDDNVLVTDPLESIKKGTILGDILTKSGTTGGNAELPIYNYNASSSAYVGNNDGACIVKSSETPHSYGLYTTHPERETSYVTQINYRAPDVNINYQSGNVSDNVNRSNWNSFVAPQFIVASSWGMSGSVLTFGQAFLRCATYQEDGYPAGRWRLPTEEEIKYLNLLNSKDILPNLLNGSYWASSGRMYQERGGSFDFQTSYANNTNSHHASARCIYDSWYWGENPVASTTDSYTIKTTL